MQNGVTPDKDGKEGSDLLWARGPGAGLLQLWLGGESSGVWVLTCSHLNLWSPPLRACVLSSAAWM